MCILNAEAELWTKDRAGSGEKLDFRHGGGRGEDGVGTAEHEEIIFMSKR